MLTAMTTTAAAVATATPKLPRAGFLACLFAVAVACGLGPATADDTARPAEPQRTVRANEDPHEAALRRIQYRYGDPRTARWLSSVSTNQLLSVFLETSRLIDDRAFDPTSYDVRTNRALYNLSAAVKTAEFNTLHGIDPGEREAWAFRQSLSRLAGSTAPRTSREALNVMYSAMNLASRYGVPAKTVAAEFVWAAAESLDKYSSFEPEVAATGRSSSTGLEESVVGIGVEIKMVDEGVRVEKVLRGGPAERGGLRKKDVILSVNGQSLAGANVQQAADAITGPAGSRVLLKILRDGREGLFTLNRERVKIHSVSEITMIDEDAGVGYVSLDKFAGSTMEEMNEALWKLHRQGMRSLIVDVRGNPGGLLTTAVDLSNKFLPCGEIVSTRGRTASDNMAERATYEQTWSVPVVVLVDGNSASASEIFAAAIQENERGVVVGTKSYGKGTVQTHFPLQSVSGNLKLTTAKFYSPTGRPMAGAGVTPDIEVDDADSDDDRDEVLEKAVDVARSQDTADLAKNAPGCPLRQS